MRTLDLFNAEVEALWVSTHPGNRHETEPGGQTQDILARLPTMSGRGLDYGCGGGAGLSAMLLAGCDDVLGVDLSVSTAGDGTYPVVHPAALADLPEGSFAAAVCTSVLQHALHGDHAIAILEELARLTAVGAPALIQCRYYEPGDRYDPATANPDYAVRYIHSHAWQVGHFWSVLAKTGWQPSKVQLDPWRHYAWYSCTRVPAPQRTGLPIRHARG